uniref:Uncharacterized protein n=1 Tax=Arundo donax TaxID=35708 RepID=A0A0A9ANJ5_ARUDO
MNNVHSENQSTKRAIQLASGVLVPLEKVTVILSQ